MINALRYGLATFLSFSKPLTFLLLSTLTFLLVTQIGQVINQLIETANQGLSSSTGGQSELEYLSTFRSLSEFGAQTSVMNALVLFFLSVPVAGQFAQEYRFNTLANTFIAAPRRAAVFLSKTFFALVYVAASVAIMWAIISVFGRALPAPLNQPGSTGIFNPAYSAGGDFVWQLKPDEDWWRIVLYVFGYMFIVISFSVITQSQTLGVLIPVFYLGFVESAAAISDAVNMTQVKQGDWIPDQLRFFVQGHAWINQDPSYEFAGLIYFGGIAALMGVSLWLFVRRNASA